MALRKKENANVRRQYPLFVQLGLVLSLAVLITAFRVDYNPASEFQIDEVDQPLIEMKDVKITIHEKEPLPPQKPRIPVSVPDDELIEDESLDLDTVLDIEEVLQIPDLPEIEKKEEERSDPFMIVEEMPKPIGGIAGILNRIRYPEMAKRAGVEGRVFIQFVVDVDGNVVDPQVTRALGAGCDEAAIEALKQTKFTPGLQRGKPVPVRMTIPVTFSLR